MLRIHLMQHWYALSDPAMEDALIEVPKASPTAGKSFTAARKPRATALMLKAV
jgi:IS5 family transposase